MISAFPLQRLLRHPAVLGVVAFVVAMFASVVAGNAADTGEGLAFFENRIRPVLSAKAKKVKGGLLLETRGGVKPGHRHGVPDDNGAEGVEGKVHIHDLHATMLHLLGLDHDKFTYRYSGRDRTLTDLKGNVVKEILT